LRRKSQDREERGGRPNIKTGMEKVQGKVKASQYVARGTRKVGKRKGEQKIKGMKRYW